MMVANVRGELGHITGQVVIDEGDLTRSSVEARIEVAPSTPATPSVMSTCAAVTSWISPITPR